jgi:hypothetical protein
MDEWIDRAAEALGEDPVTPEEVRAVLELAREVAHGVERRLAPVSTYIAGLSVAGRMKGPGSRADVLREVADALLRLVPPAPDG